MGISVDDLDTFTLEEIDIFDDEKGERLRRSRWTSENCPFLRRTLEKSASRRISSKTSVVADVAAADAPAEAAEARGDDRHRGLQHCGIDSAVRRKLLCQQRGIFRNVLAWPAVKRNRRLNSSGWPGHPVDRSQ